MAQTKKEVRFEIVSSHYYDHVQVSIPEPWQFNHAKSTSFFLILTSPLDMFRILYKIEEIQPQSVGSILKLMPDDQGLACLG